jgi:hypothetical protein
LRPGEARASWQPPARDGCIVARRREDDRFTGGPIEKAMTFALSIASRKSTTGTS